MSRTRVISHGLTLIKCATNYITLMSNYSRIMVDREPLQISVTLCYLMQQSYLWLANVLCPLLLNYVLESGAYAPHTAVKVIRGKS